MANTAPGIAATGDAQRLSFLMGLFIALLKDTSLAFIVNVPELTTVAGQVNSRVQVYPAAIFIFTGLVYYLLCSGLNYMVSLRYRRRGTIATPSPLKV